MTRVINVIMVIYFSIGALIPNCDFSQLLKVKELVSHYNLHQQEAIMNNEMMSFTDFLVIHFVDIDDHQHEDHNEHEKLPFQQLNSSISSYVLTAFDFPSLSEEIPLLNNNILKEIHFLSSDFTSCPFQPPAV